MGEERAWERGWIVRRLDNFIQRINPYPRDIAQSKLRTRLFYPLDRDLSAAGFSRRAGDRRFSPCTKAYHAGCKFWIHFIFGTTLNVSTIELAYFIRWIEIYPLDIIIEVSYNRTQVYKFVVGWLVNRGLVSWRVGGGGVNVVKNKCFRRSRYCSRNIFN